MRPSKTSRTPRESAPTQWALPQPGELFVALDADGHWCRELAFVGFADGRPDRLLFALPGGAPGETVLLSPSEVMRPRVAEHRAVPPSGTVAPDRPARPASPGCVGFVPVGPASFVGPAFQPVSARGALTRRGRRNPIGIPITTAQRRAMFAESRRLGMDIDALRAAVPGGSISRLTRAEAAEVLDRLRGRVGQAGCATSRRAGIEQCPQSTASAAQRQYAADLAAACGLDTREFSRWLKQRFAVDNVACLSRSQARSAIQALLQMRSKRGELDARRLRKRSFA